MSNMQTCSSLTKALLNKQANSLMSSFLTSSHLTGGLGLDLPLLMEFPPVLHAQMEILLQELYEQKYI